MKRLLSALALVTLPCTVLAASDTFEVKIASVPATSIDCVINYPAGQTAFYAPLAAGTTVGICSVQPSNWQGWLKIQGGSGKFVINGMNIVAGTTPVGFGTYNGTVLTEP